MRQLVSGLTLFVTMCLLAPVSDARAPKPPNFTGASVQFRDGETDRIGSDGGGPYVDGGRRGLEVRMWINGSQDLTIGRFSSGRTLYFDYSDKVPGSGSGPTGIMNDNAFVNIRDIAESSPASPEPIRPTTLWRVPVDGGAPVSTATSAEGIRDLSIHPDGRRIAFNAGWRSNEHWAMDNLLAR